MKTKIQAMYFVIFIARRLVFLFIVLYMTYSLAMQIMALLLLNFFVTIYLGTRPFSNRWLFRSALFEEFMIQLLYVHMMCFTKFVPDEATRSLYGWSMITWMSIHLLF